MASATQALVHQPAMAEEKKSLHLLFFPFLIQSHMQPLIETACNFADRGVRVSFVTTPLNAAYVRRRAISREPSSVELLTISFPSSDYIQSMPSTDHEQRKFYSDMELLREPFEQLLRDHRPDCVISDAFLYWTASSANSFNIPRIFFFGTGFSSLLTMLSIHNYISDGGPESKGTNSDVILLTNNLPRPVEFIREKLMKHTGAFRDWFGEFHDRVCESVHQSYGVMLNTFYELEPVYADYLRGPMGMPSWHVGPLFGNSPSKPSGEQQQCLEWLDTMPDHSVVYASFGTLFRPTISQLHEIARGIAASGYYFIWVARSDEWLPPEGLLDENSKGYVVNWAPQVTILNHRATSLFVSHCGWGSMIEAVVAGMPMITWPIYGDHFDAERLVIEDLKIGTRVSSEAWGWRGPREDVVKVSAAEVTRSIKELMDDRERIDGMRRRAKEMSKKAKRAVDVGGTSYNDIGRLLEELRRRKEVRDE